MIQEVAVYRALCDVCGYVFDYSGDGIEYLAVAGEWPALLTDAGWLADTTSQLCTECRPLPEVSEPGTTPVGTVRVVPLDPSVRHTAPPTIQRQPGDLT